MWLAGAAFLVASIGWAVVLAKYGDILRPYIGATDCSGDGSAAFRWLLYFATIVVTVCVVPLAGHIIRRDNIAFGSLLALAAVALIVGLIAGWPLVRVTSTNCGV